ncbi:hypothetical protein HDV00_002627 [Rhizophlyctis rosea]|nr:hypothetical protein HDV00_002627 [Rhizophlyctis rosea]
MEDVCDLPSKFLEQGRDESTFGGRFATFLAGNSNTRQTASWFYRYNDREIEVREIRTAKSIVVAKINATELASDEDEVKELRITFVTHACLRNVEYLIICCSMQSAESRVWLYNPLTLSKTCPCTTDLGETITAAAVTERIPGTDVSVSAYYLLVGTDRNLYHCQISAMGHHDANLSWGSTYGTSYPRPVTAIASYVRATDPKPVVIFGTDSGDIDIGEVGGDRYYRMGGFQSGVHAPVSHILVDAAPSPKYGTFVAAFGNQEQSHARIVSCLIAVETGEVGPPAIYQPAPNDPVGYVSALTMTRVSTGHKLYAGLRTLQHGSSWLNSVSMILLQDGLDPQIATQDVTYASAYPILDFHMESAMPYSYVLHMNKLCTFVDSESLPVVKEAEQIWTHQHHVGDFVYAKQREQILSRRRARHNELFFDKLLTACGVDVALYPPRDIREMQKLLDGIEPLRLLWRDSLLLYLLLDRHDGKESSFVNECMIHQSYYHATKGYWCMDHGRFKEAVQYLTQPSVNNDWPNQVLLTLRDNGEWAEAARFLEIVQPAAESVEDIAIQMDILLRTDIQRSNALTSLLNSNFSSEEERFVIQYCRKSTNPMAKEFLAIYLMNRGQYGEMVSFFSSSGGQMSGPSGRIISNIRMVLPGVQAKTLALPTEPAPVTRYSKPAPAFTAATPVANGRREEIDETDMPLSASRHVRSDIVPLAETQKSFIQAVHTHTERIDSSAVRSPVTPTESSPMDVEQPSGSEPFAVPTPLRSPAALSCASPISPLSGSPRSPIESVPAVKSPPFVRSPQSPAKLLNGNSAKPPIAPGTAPAQMGTEHTFPSNSIRQSYQSYQPSYTPRPELYRPSPLRHELQAPVPMNVTPAFNSSTAPFAFKPASTVNGVDASSIATPSNAQSPRESELRGTPASNAGVVGSAKSGGSAESVKSIRSSVGSASPIGPPLLNQSPFAPKPQADVERKKLSTPPTRTIEKPRLASPALPDTGIPKSRGRARGQRKAVAANTSQEMHQDDMEDIEMQDASSAATSKTPRRKQTRFADNLESTEHQPERRRALRATPARRSRFGVDEGDEMLKDEEEAPVPSTRKSARRSTKKQVEEEPHDIDVPPVTPSNRTKRSAGASVRASSKKAGGRGASSSVVSDEPMTLDDLGTPGPSSRPGTAKSSRRKANIVDTPLTERRITRRMAKEMEDHQ